VFSACSKLTSEPRASTIERNLSSVDSRSEGVGRRVAHFAVGGSDLQKHFTLVILRSSTHLMILAFLRAPAFVDKAGWLSFSVGLGGYTGDTYDTGTLEGWEFFGGSALPADSHLDKIVRDRSATRVVTWLVRFLILSRILYSLILSWGKSTFTMAERMYVKFSISLFS